MTTRIDARKKRLSNLLWMAALASAGLVATALAAGERSDAAPVELGQVEWLRDYDQATERSRAQDKPIFLLFQEIPGCQTCVSFGEEVLSHPLIVEAIEDEFVPLAIRNNRPGRDRIILEQFGEPAWNNPVVRFVGRDGRDLIPRKDGVWRKADIVRRMLDALSAADRPAPPYLTALADELAPTRIEKATFAMHCYWEGEACLGALPGLLSSRTGALDGREVVEIRFDASRIDYPTLLREAKARGCAEAVFAHGGRQSTAATAIFGEQARLARGFARDASERDQKFHLKRNRATRELELTPAQATRLNHAIWARKAWRADLSPRQRVAAGGR